MGKKKIAILDLSQSETPQLKASGVRDQRIKIKKQPETTPIESPIEKTPTPVKPTTAPASKKPAKKTTKTKIRIKHPRSRRYLEAKKLIDKNKNYQLKEAIKLLRQVNTAKFDATVELHCNLSADKVSGELSLPHGSGKSQTIEIASDATLVKLKDGIIDFDVLIAEPKMMSKLAKYAKLLGPKGLMPNPKAGTVSDQPEALKKKLAGGAIRFKSEAKNPLLHLTVGKLSFTDQQLEANINAALAAIKPKNIAAAYLCSSISPSIKLAV